MDADVHRPGRCTVCDMGMSEADAQRLRDMQRDAEQAHAAWRERVRERNAFMHELYNGHRADIPDLQRETGIRSRDYVHRKVQGPRTNPAQGAAKRRGGAS